MFFSFLTMHLIVTEKTTTRFASRWRCRKIIPARKSRIFLMADAVTAAIPAQGTPQGYYNIERMMRSVIAKGGQVELCGSCCEARGIKALPLLEGAEPSTMNQLALWSMESEKVLVF